MTKGSAQVGEKLVYRPVFEAFVAGLADRSSPSFHLELAALGVNLQKLLPGYPYEVWEKAVLCGARLFTELERPQAIAEVGRRLTLATIGASPVGKHLLPLLKVMGTGRALRRVYSHSTGENYNVVSFGAETPQSLEMHMTDVGNIPDMARGSIIGMGESMGISLRAQITAFSAPRVTYLIEWG